MLIATSASRCQHNERPWTAIIFLISIRFHDSFTILFSFKSWIEGTKQPAFMTIQKSQNIQLETALYMRIVYVFFLCKSGLKCLHWQFSTIAKNHQNSRDHSCPYSTYAYQCWFLLKDRVPVKASVGHCRPSFIIVLATSLHTTNFKTL